MEYWPAGRGHGPPKLVEFLWVILCEPGRPTAGDVQGWGLPRQSPLTLHGIAREVLSSSVRRASANTLNSCLSSVNTCLDSFVAACSLQFWHFLLSVLQCVFLFVSGIIVFKGSGHKLSGLVVFSNLRWSSTHPLVSVRKSCS